MKQLLGSPESVPLRANVLAAKKLSEEALRLIDDEVNIHKKLCTCELRPFDDYYDYYDEGDEYDWREYDFFLEERKKLLWPLTVIRSILMG